MEALIIAAGRGIRLNHHFSPKPLVMVNGHRMIEHIILKAKNAGIHCLRIVVGYKADLIMETTGTGEDLGVKIEYIYNPEWEKGNGISVLAAREHFKDKFILLMADHLFEGGIVEKVIKAEPEDSRSLLCVDRNLGGSHINLDDATKVWINGDRIKKIGKVIPAYNAVDTGIFLYHPNVFEALEESIAQGKDSLSDANQILSDWGKLIPLDVTDHIWIDVDDKEAFLKAKDIVWDKL
jgi:choline kinase